MSHTSIPSTLTPTKVAILALCNVAVRPYPTSFPSPTARSKEHCLDFTKNANVTNGPSLPFRVSLSSTPPVTLVLPTDTMQATTTAV